MLVVFGTRGRAFAVQARGFDFEQFPFQTVTRRCHLLVVATFQPSAGQLGCLAQTYDARNVFRAGTARALVAPAMEHRLQRSSLADAERAHSLRPVKLVARNGEQVASDLVDVDRDLTRRLHRVSVEVDIGFGGNLADLRRRVAGRRSRCWRA